MSALVLWGCSPSNYAFEKKAFEQSDCPKIECSLPFANGCRFVNPTKDFHGCVTSCGTATCDAPSRPEILSLEQILDVTELQWKAAAAPGTVRYRVVREVTDEALPKVSDVNFPVTKSTDSNLQFGKEHFYSVIAVSEFGQSAPSEKRSLVPIERFSIEKDSVGPGTATIAFKTVLGAVEYEVLTGNAVSNLTLNSRAVITVSSGKNKATVTGLTNGQPIFIQVLAKNPKVKRLSDNILSVIPYDGFQLVSRSAGDSVATLSWSKLSGATKYQLRYWPVNAPASVTKIDGLSAQTAVVSALTNGTIYEFKACGWLGAECVDTSNSLLAEPIAPPSITAVAGYLAKVEIGWASVSGATGYSVSADKNGMNITNTGPLSGSASSASLNLPAVGEIHSLKVTATNDHGGVATSSPRDGVPLGPFSITAITAGDGTIDLSWTASAGATNYAINYDDNGVAKSIPVGGALTRKLTGITNGKNFTATVRATRTNQGGFVDTSSRSALPRGGFRVLSAVDGLKSEQVSWENLAGAVSYEVKVRDASVTNAPFTSGSVTSQTAAKISGLSKEVRYEFKVEAKLSDGSFVVSSNSVFGIPFGEFSLVSAAPDIEAVDLAWENYFSGSAYEVYAWESGQNEMTKAFVSPLGLTATTFRVTGLKEGVSYKFRVIAKINGHVVTATPDLEALVKSNPIKRFKPALAVRGVSCMICHAKITSNLVTDLGVGSPNFVPRGRTSSPFDQDLQRRRFFSDWNGDLESAYSNQRAAFQNANAIIGTIYVPKVTIPAADLEWLVNTDTASRFPAGISMKGLFEDRTGVTDGGGNNLPMVDRVSPVNGSEKVSEKSEVKISYPTREEILGLLPADRRTEGTVTGVLSDFAKVSSLSGMISKNGIVSHPVGAELNCFGDVVIVGTVVLRNPTIVTDGKGCRLYVTGSVFIQGEIPLKSTESAQGKKPTLQISSARSILMGISHFGMIGEMPNATGPRDGFRKSNDPGLAQGGHTRFASRLDFQYNPSGAAINGVPSEQFFTGLVEEARKVEAVEGIALMDAGDRNLLNAGVVTPGTIRVGDHLKANYEGLLFNAPHVHSRYFGDFKGIIIAEVAFMARNPDASTVNEEFHYDPVFDSVPLMLPLLPRVPLIIKD